MTLTLVVIPAAAPSAAVPATAASPRKGPNNEGRRSKAAEEYSWVDVTRFARTPPAGRSNISCLLGGFPLSIEASTPFKASTGIGVASKGGGDGYPGGGSAAFQEDDDDDARNHNNRGVLGICVFDEMAETKCRWQAAHTHRGGNGGGRGLMHDIACHNSY